MDPFIVSYSKHLLLVHSDVTDLGILTLYSTAWLNLRINSDSFLVICLKSAYQLMSSANSFNLISRTFLIKNKYSQIIILVVPEVNPLSFYWQTVWNNFA